MTQEFNLVIAGVGGQGSILISEVLGRAAVRAGLPVKGTETIGIAQRGAPVVGMLRLGTGPESPSVPEGRAHLMIAMESVEALRNVSLMARSGVVLLNTQRVVPVMVLLGSSVYPSLEEIVAKLGKNSSRVVPLDAVKIAREAGSTTSANIVMLGAAFGSGLLPLEIGLAKAELEARFSGEARRANIRALELGCQAYRES